MEVLLEEMAKDNKAILEQTSKTNGRVTKLEEWKNRIVGALVVIGVVIGWVVSLIH